MKKFGKRCWESLICEIILSNFKKKKIDLILILLKSNLPRPEHDNIKVILYLISKATYLMALYVNVHQQQLSRNIKCNEFHESKRTC